MASVVQTIPASHAGADGHAHLELRLLSRAPRAGGLQRSPSCENTVAGIQALDRDVIESATALRMTPRQRLFQVELPWPRTAHRRGLRTSTVWIVGTATPRPRWANRAWATRSSAGCRRATSTRCSSGRSRCVRGHVGCALRARRASSFSKAAVPSLVSSRSRRSPSCPRCDPRSSPAIRAQRSAAFGHCIDAPRPLEARSVRVGLEAFTSSTSWRRRRACSEAAGLRVDRRESLGSTVAFDALRSNQIDVYVDYSGTLWSTRAVQEGTAPSWRVLAETCGQLAAAITCRLGPRFQQNAYALAMRADRAKQLEVAISTIWRAQAPALTLGDRSRVPRSRRVDCASRRVRPALSSGDPVRPDLHVRRGLRARGRT